jgi:hypothetical protein
VSVLMDKNGSCGTTLFFLVGELTKQLTVPTLIV